MKKSIKKKKPPKRGLTDHLHVEPSLRNSELRYRRLFETAQDGILILDAKTGAITDVNPYLIALLGYSCDEFTEKKLWEVGAFKDIAASKEAFETLQRNEYIRYENLPLRAKDGRLIQVEFVSNVYLVGDEQVIQCNIRDITEHKRLVAALRENERKYHALVNQSPDGIFLFDLSGNFSVVNQAMCDRLGFSEAELRSMKIWEIIPEQHLKQYRKRLTKILDGESLNESSECTVRGKDGKIIFIEVLSAPYYSEKGIIGFQGIARDITERKRAEEALMESSARFHTLFEASPDAILLIDPHDHWPILDCNAAACQMNRYTRDELVGQSIDVLNVTPGDPTERAGYMDRIRQSRVLRLETIHRRKDGTRFPVEVSTSMIALDGRDVVLGIDRDITERKRAEEALRESEERFRSILDNIEDGYYEVDTAGNLTFFNPAHVRMLGRPANELMGMNYRRYMTPESAKAVFQTFNQVFRTGIPEQAFDWELVRPDGTRRSIEVSVSLIKAADGSINGFRGTVRDITARKRAEQEIASLAKFPSENPNPVLRLSRDGIVIYVNAASGALLGMWGCAVGGSAPQSWRDLITQALASGENKTVDVELDGKVYSIFATPVAEAGYVNLYGRDITERKRAEAEIAYQANLLAEVNDAIVASDDQYRLTAWNKAAEALYGWKSEQVLGQNGLELMRTEWPAVDSKEMRRTIAETGRWRGEAIQQRKDGTRFPVEVSSLVLRDDSGQITGYISVNRDITARKRAEEKLEKLSSVVEQATDLVFITDYDGVIEYVNPAFERLTGYTKDESIGQTPRILKSGKQTPDEYKQLWETIRAGKVLQGTVVNRKKDGELFYEEKIIAPLRDEQGNITHFVSTGRDITERKRAEEALRASALIIEGIINAIPVRVFWKDKHLVYLGCNAEFARDAGYADPKDIIGKDDYQMGWRDQAELYRSDDRQVIESGSSKLFIEEPQTTPEGNTITLLTSKVPLRNSMGEIIGVLGTYMDITERKEGEQALRQRLVELEAIHTVSSALRAAQTRDEALPVLLDETLTALETDTGAICLYHAGSDDLHAAVTRGWFRQFNETPIKPGEGMTGTVFATGQAHITPEFAHDPVVRQPSAGQFPAGCGGVCLPIRTGAIIVGTLTVSLPPPHQITPEQMKLLESLTEMAGTTLHRMSLHEETVRQLDFLETLHSIDVAIAASTDLQMTLNILLDHVKTQLHADAASVLLLNPHLQMLEYAAGRGFRTRRIEQSRLHLGEGYAGKAALERRMTHAPNLKDVGSAYVRAQLLSDEDFVGYYAMPLMVKGEVKGVLEVYHRASFHPEVDWINFLETLAGQAAIAIDSAQLFENLQRSNMDLALAYDATIEGWSRALDLRDKETEGHTQRVTEITMQLAKAMGIGDAKLVHIRRGGLLHDIGKMGVPDSILLKPGKLTDEEWVVMRKHPQLAYDMLSPISYLRPALDIPYCHHEKWDGTGYPRGLKHEQIPLAARLFAVVDVWDALRSVRPYRAAWDEEKVREHIQSLAGTHFDPNLVPAFLRLMKQT